MTPLTMTHDADPVLARHVANARTSPTRWGEHIKKENKDSPNRIDAAMAAVIAYDRARSLGSQPARHLSPREGSRSWIGTPTEWAPFPGYDEP